MYDYIKIYKMRQFREYYEFKVTRIISMPGWLDFDDSSKVNLPMFNVGLVIRN